MSAEPAERYRTYAAECIAIAQRLEDPAERLSLIVIAGAWMVLAEYAERSPQPPPDAKLN
jgi:hypothetical protein